MSLLSIILLFTGASGRWFRQSALPRIDSGWGSRARGWFWWNSLDSLWGGVKWISRSRCWRLALRCSVFRRAATDIWNQVVSNGLGWRLPALLVLVALLFARDPELRALLFFLDYIGVDIFLMLLFFQGREMLVWSGRALWQPTTRFLEVWSWFPLPLPGPSLLRQHPGWSLLAVGQAVVTLTGVFIVAIVAVSIPRALAAEGLPNCGVSDKQVSVCPHADG